MGDWVPSRCEPARGRHRGRLGEQPMKVIVPEWLADYLRPPMRAVHPRVELVPLSADGRAAGTLEDAEVLYKYYIKALFPQFYGADVLRRIVRDAQHLRWIASGWAGVDAVLIPELIDRDIIVTSAAGAVKRAIAETVLCFILMDTKEILGHLQLQRERRWQMLKHRELRGLTVAILGLGKIGLEVAALCQPLGMRVIGTKRRITGDPLPYVDQVFPPAEQNDCVSQADYVVIAAALTEETERMVDASMLGAMRPEAVLINMGRGGHVDEPALIAALREKRIKAAYLDAFVEEPLPPDSPLWSLPSVLVMPHNSATSQHLVEHTSSLFVENFRRYCAGEPLMNLVDKKAGY